MEMVQLPFAGMPPPEKLALLFTLGCGELKNEVPHVVASVLPPLSPNGKFSVPPSIVATALSVLVKVYVSVTCELVSTDVGLTATVMIGGGRLI